MKKKFFALLLSVIMSVNLGMMVYADEGAATENIFKGGNFEDKGDFIYANDKITGIENNSVAAIWSQHAYIMGYTNESHGGDKALHIKNVNAYYPVTFKADLDRGALYKVSAWVKAANGEPKMNWAVTTQDWEWSEGEDVYISNDGNFNNMYKAESIWGNFANNVVSVTGNEWTKIERILYVTESGSNSTFSAWMGLASYQSNFEYYIDDVVLEKIGIRGATFVTIPQEGSVNVNYEIVGADYFENQEITLKETYPGVSIENGVLNVTSEAIGGTIVLCVKKTLNGEEKVMAQYNVDLHKCVAASAENIFKGGSFEDEGDFIYVNDKITGIENNSVVATWPQHAYILGYAPEKYCGDKALHIKNVNAYYPVTFKADLDRGALYKVSAWVKAANGEPKMNWAVTTQDWEWSEGEDVYISNDGNFNNMYKAESIWGNFANNVVSVTGNEWTKIERILYVTGSGSNSTISAWIGLASYQSEFEYYIDDVVLEKLSEVKIEGADSIDIPDSDSTASEYSVNNVDAYDKIVLDKEYEGVSFENGVLTISKSAKKGIVTLNAVKTAGTDEIVIAKKNVALFDEKGIFVNVEDTTEGQKIMIGIKGAKTIEEGAVLYMARYEKEILAEVKSVSLDEFDGKSYIIDNISLGVGANKIMIWSKLNTMKPLCENVSIEK